MLTVTISTYVYTCCLQVNFSVLTWAFWQVCVCVAVRQILEQKSLIQGMIQQKFSWKRSHFSNQDSTFDLVTSAYHMKPCSQASLFLSLLWRIQTKEQKVPGNEATKSRYTLVPKMADYDHLYSSIFGWFWFVCFYIEWEKQSNF